jgi:hypothetical protein
MRCSALVVVLLGAVAPLGVFAAPAPVSAPPESVVEDAAVLKVQSVAPLSAAEIDSYVPYGWFASAAYCPPETRTNWQCSECCVESLELCLTRLTESCQTESVKDFEVYQSGGDGAVIQYCAYSIGLGASRPADRGRGRRVRRVVAVSAIGGSRASGNRRG